MSLMPATYCCGCPCDECTSTTCYNYYLVVYRELYEPCPDSPFLACGSFRYSFSAPHVTNSCTAESAETIRQLFATGTYFDGGAHLLYAEGVYGSDCDDFLNGYYTMTVTYECYLIHSTTTAICPQVWVSSRNEMITASITINTNQGNTQWQNLNYNYIYGNFFEVLSDVNDPDSVCEIPLDQSENDWYITINTDSCPPYDNMTEAEIEAHIIACCT